MQFKQVVGQDKIKKRLIDSVTENRVSHALLFSGKNGTGTLPMALAYAQYVNCQNKQDGDSCGTCSSCRKQMKMIHPDVHFVFPVIKSKKLKEPISDDYIETWRNQILQQPYIGINKWHRALNSENAQSSIYVFESDAIIRKLNLKTYEAEYKVMIIWMSERMNVQCANKLLKIIEEPPEKTLFILITENEEQILSTIRSRTQLVPFKGINSADIEKSLGERSDSQNLNLSSLAHLANGDFEKAIDLIHPDADQQFNFDHFCDLMRMSYKRDWFGIFTWIDELTSAGRERQKNFLSYSLRMIRENFMLNLNDPSLVYLNDEEEGFSKRFSPFINERNILIFAKEFEDAYRDISHNGNPGIIFQDMSFKIIKHIRD